MLTFLGTLVYQQRDICGQGFSDPDAKAVGVQSNAVLTIDGATNTPGHAKVYGSGVVVFAAVGENPDPDRFNPFPDYSTTSIDGRGFQMDILNVDIRWFNAGDQFDFWDGIVYDAAAGGTEAVVDLWHGDVHVDSGSLPPLGSATN